MTRPCHNPLPRHAIEKYLQNQVKHCMKADFSRIAMALHFALGLILDATLRAIIDAIWDLFRGKHGTKIDARTIIEPGPF